MAYIYAVRGWLELSWPDAEIEGVDESPEEHAAKVERIRALLTTSLPPEKLTMLFGALQTTGYSSFGTARQYQPSGRSMVPATGWPSLPITHTFASLIVSRRRTGSPSGT